DGTLVSDSGADIRGLAHPAYNYFGSRTRLKLVNLFRLLLSYDGAIEVRWGVSPDYTNVRLTSISYRGASQTGTAWDAGAWDTFPWSGSAERFKLWRAAAHAPG